MRRRRGANVGQRQARILAPTRWNGDALAVASRDPIAVLLSQVPEEGPTWVHLVRAGEHYPRSGGAAVALTRQDLADAVAGFVAAMGEGWWPRGAPLGYNHAAARGALDPDSTAAAGYITALRVTDDGGSLEACVDWTADGRRRVRAGDFQALSAEILFGPQSKRANQPLGPSAAIVGATLTNDPMVPGLRRVAASETVQESPKMKRTAALLGLAETVTPSDDQIAVALSERDGRITTLSETLRSVTADRDAAQKQVAEFVAADAKRAVAIALSEGRIKDTDGERALFAKLSDVEREMVFPKGRVTGTAGAVPPAATATAASPEVSARLLSERAVAEAAKSGRPAHAVYADLLRAPAQG